MGNDLRANISRGCGPVPSVQVCNRELVTIDRRSGSETTYINSGSTKGLKMGRHSCHYSELIKIENSIYKETTILKKHDIKSKDPHADTVVGMGTIIEEERAEKFVRSMETESAPLATNNPKEGGCFSFPYRPKQCGISHVLKVSVKGATIPMI